jgi:hypothetical protein
MFKLIAMLFFSSIALAVSSDISIKYQKLISETQDLALKVSFLREEIFAAQTKLVSLSMTRGFSKGGGILTREESIETMGYISDLVEKASQIMAREYLSDPDYTLEKFEKTHIEFNKIIDKYLEVIFNIAQREHNIKPKVSLEDYNQFIKAAKKGIQPKFSKEDLKTQDIIKAMDAYKKFTHTLEKKNVVFFIL